MELEIGNYYMFKFFPGRGGMAGPPDTKAKVIETMPGQVKVDVDGHIAVWPMHMIRNAVQIIAGGRRRKASRKIRRKTYRKSRRVSRK